MPAHERSYSLIISEPGKLESLAASRELDIASEYGLKRQAP